jgi:tRNA-specific adenosine deaminase 3
MSLKARKIWVGRKAAHSRLMTSLMYSTAEAYVVEIPTQLASKALKWALIHPASTVSNLLTSHCSILRPILPRSVETSSSYYYLRRLVTTTHLPSSLRDSVQLQDGPTTIHLLIAPPLPPAPNEIVAVLRPHVGFWHLPVVRTTRIPLEPPTTAEQAAVWSNNYWPCTFNPASLTIQKAPPLRLLRTTQAELNEAARLESYFGLARIAAKECVSRALGKEVAAVVVDPVTEEVTAVAADARWFRQSGELVISKVGEDGLAEGRPEQHALMRAIAIVAEKEERRQSGSRDSSDKADGRHGTDLGQRAITPIEKWYAATNEVGPTSPEQSLELPPAQSAERPDAYLCNGMDVYLTHEPCVACSMAMIHSRFRACVFIKRMPRTGGLCAEKDDGGLGYGLFWRKELNWRVMTFQYLPSSGSGSSSSSRSSSSSSSEKMVAERADGDAEANFHA